ncbi:MAG: NADPH-dependent oxidoreductase [Sphingobacteriales bacterium]|nr:MAG: NADPH-dependent oxidoreductase [Sphingobacteriales bacterium]
MITIISGTNRKDSMTLKVAKLYYNMMSQRADDVQLLTLEDLNVWDRSAELIATEERLLIPSEKFVFVMPEYNGSFPGILKLMLDNSDIKKCWWYKKAMLVGVADGRAGNLRGMEHMTNILHYLRVNVLYNKVPISRINDEINEAGDILKPATELVIIQQIEEFLKF